MNTLEIQSIKSHFSNVLSHYNNLKKKFVDSSSELESLNIQLIELKNKMNNLTMESSIIYFFEVKELLAAVEKTIFDLDIEIENPPVDPNPDPEPEVILPTIGSVELSTADKKATVVSKSISDIQGRLTQVTYNLKTSVRNVIEQRTTTTPTTPVTFNSILTAGDYVVEAIYSYTGANSLEQITKHSNIATIKEDVIVPPPSTEAIATLKLTSSQSWGTGFSANLELISHSDENFAGNWELSFDSPASSLSQWQINASKVGNRIVITSGTDWSGAPNFNLGPNSSFKIDGINGNGAPFDSNIAANATLNGNPVTLMINGEVIGGGTTPDPEPEVILPTIGSVELSTADKKATVVSKSISDIQGRLTQVTYNLKTSVRNVIEQRTTTTPTTPVTFNSILTAGDYVVEAIYSYTGANSLEQITKHSNIATIKEDVIVPPPSTEAIATLKLTSSQSWGTGFSANLELISHSDENFAGNWELSFDSPASSLSQWQINASKVGNRIVITSGTDWSGAPNFNLGPNSSFKIDGINGNGAPFDSNIAANATLNGNPVTLMINGEVIGGGTTPDPEPNPDPETPTVAFPDRLPILGSTEVGTIYLNGEETTVLGTVSVPHINIHSEYAIYVNGFKTSLKPVELTRRSSMLNVNIAVSTLPLLTGNNEVQLVFAGIGETSVTYFTTNTLTLKKESTGTSKKSLIGYWSSWNGNSGVTKYIDLEAVPSEYDTIVVSFIEHSNDYLTPQFNPEADGKVTRSEFVQKVARMKAKGHNVIIAVGGQNGVFHLGSENDKKVFVDGVIRIIEEFGFNGFDVDLEGQSAQNGTKYVVDAIQEIVEYFRAKDPNFVYSMAPEVAYLISEGFGRLYADLITQTKHLITTIHPQFYNAPGTGIYPFDGSGNAVMCNDQAKFIPEFTEALIKGHDGPAWGGAYAQLFPIGPIPEEILAIGLPAGVGAAGTGAINDMNVFTNAWREIQRRGYENVKGFMTWSIDWDEHHNWQFKNAIAPLIK